MIGPLAETGEVSYSVFLWLAAFPIGFLFGYALQRTGFTDARKIAAVFYLKDVDVPVAMLSAIVTGMLGLWGMSLLGLVDIAQVYLLPTYLAPMAVGGLLFGIGMVISGYCPGTAFAAVVTGKLDALVFALGFLVGTLLFGDLFPVWKIFYQSDFLGVFRLDQAFGIGLGPTVLLVVLIAVAAGVGLRRLQQYLWHNLERPPSWGIRTLVSLAVLSAAVLAFVPDRSFFAITNTAGSMGGWDQSWGDPYESVMVDPLTAGRVAYRYQDRLHGFDLRSLPEYDQSHLPGFLPATPAELEAMDFGRSAVVLAYGRPGDPGVRDVMRALRQRGVRAFGVEGGFEALRPYYLDPLSPQLKAALSAGELSQLEEYRAVWSPHAGPITGAPES